jgi:hypothetical protein
MSEKSFNAGEEDLVDDRPVSNDETLDFEQRLDAKLDPIRKDILAIRLSVSVILRKLDSR